MTPSRLGAIDIGSNAIRLRIIESNGHGRQLLTETRLPVRLGLATYGRGFLDGGSIASAVEGLRGLREACRAHGVERYRAVATAALRDAPNRAELVDLVAKDGILIEVIPGEEESRLLYLGLAADEIADGPVAMIELGTGSLQVASGNGADPDFLACLPMGGLRLAIQHRAREAMSDAQVKALEAGIRAGLAGTRQALRERGVRRLLGAGGGFRVASLLGRPQGAAPGHLRLADLKPLVGRLAKMTARQREGLGLPADRADSIVPAACLAQVLIEMLGVEQMELVDTNLRDGILADLARHPERGRQLPA